MPECQLCHTNLLWEGRTFPPLAAGGPRRPLPATSCLPRELYLHVLRVCDPSCRMRRCCFRSPSTSHHSAVLPVMCEPRTPRDAPSLPSPVPPCHKVHPQKLPHVISIDGPRPEVCRVTSFSCCRGNSLARQPADHCHQMMEQDDACLSIQGCLRHP